MDARDREESERRRRVAPDAPSHSRASSPQGHAPEPFAPATTGLEDVAGALIRALWLRDADTGAHSQRVAGYAARLCDLLGIEPRERTIITLGALLHDVGKIGIPDSILLKPSALDSREWNEMRAHPAYGRRVLESLPHAEPVAKLIYHHHERLDGQGYPEGLQGDEVTLSMRVVILCDAADAMLTRRPYREALRPDQAVAELFRNAGSQFDADLVHLLVSMLAPDLARLQRGAG